MDDRPTALALLVFPTFFLTPNRRSGLRLRFPNVINPDGINPDGISLV